MLCSPSRVSDASGAAARLRRGGESRESTTLALTTPFDGKPATHGNGGMVALRVATPEAVNRVHERALALGAIDEGAPGPRGESGFYAGYFRDLDGNKLNVYVPASRTPEDVTLAEQASE